jgi:methionyl aminopeptidase
VSRFSFQETPELKSAREIALMSEAAKVVAEALSTCRAMAKPGVRTIEIDQAAEAFYSRRGALPLFKGYPGRVPFPAVTALSIDEQVLHGIPGPRVLREGDLFKINTACKLNGWCAVGATNVPIGTVRPEKLRLLQVAEELLGIAEVEMTRRKWWSEVALRMQQHVERAGFSVAKQYVGHGIGRIMHEPPQAPSYVDHDTRKHDFRLEPGLVLAVTPLVCMGKAATRILDDQWTVVTVDGMPSVHVQRTLVLTPEGAYDITALCPTCNGSGRAMLFVKCGSCNGSGWRK